MASDNASWVPVGSFPSANPLNMLSPFVWYRLELDQFPGVCLDIINDGTAHEEGKLQMAPSGSYTGQHWQFLPASDGSFVMRTSYTGSDMLLLCDNLDPHLSRTTDERMHAPTCTVCWFLEATSQESYFRIRAGLSDDSKRYYLGTEHVRDWFNGERLRLKEYESSIIPQWKVTEIKPVDLSEYLIAPLVLPQSSSGWTNIRTSPGAREHGHVSMIASNPERVRDLVKSLHFPTVPLGWAYRLDTSGRQLLYLDIHLLRWNKCSISSTNGANAPIETGYMLSFHGWTSPNIAISTITFSSYLENLENGSAILIDVSGGFASPKFLDKSDFLLSDGLPKFTASPTYSDDPPTYYSRSILVSHQIPLAGFTYVFLIRPDTGLLELENTEPRDQVYLGKWECQIAGDQITFLVDPQHLRRAGVDNPVPENFSWSSKGENAEFRSDESIPLRHMDYLGHGGHGVVDKVLCSGRVFARKQIRTHRRLELSVAMQELESIRKVQLHKHVIKVAGSYVQSHTLGILMYPVAECDLQTALEQLAEPRRGFFQGRLSFAAFEAKLWTYFGCLAHGLAFMHSKYIRHRDIKPRNILAGPDGPLYTDFGIARDFSDSLASTTSGPTERTYEYCAPEVADGGERGRSSDVFSLGCVFLELLTVLTHLNPYQDCRPRRHNGIDSSFHANPDKIQIWINDIFFDQVKEQGMANNAAVVQVLFLIRRMLNPDRKERPSAMEVWKVTTSLTIATGSSLYSSLETGSLPLSLSSSSQGKHLFCGFCCFEIPL